MLREIGNYCKDAANQSSAFVEETANQEQYGEDVRKAHDRYKLYWFLRHGYGFKELLFAVAEWLTEAREMVREGTCESLDKVPNFEDYLEEQGFHGELWPCLAEFYAAEYQNADLREDLLQTVKGRENDDQEGVCPCCGACIEYGESDTSDEGVLKHWECPKCGTTGLEGARLLFDRHYHVRGENGAPIPGRQNDDI